MSTRINTNVTAFEAARNLSANSDKLSKNIERLSSGMRINSAADDAAGLVISQNMKAQLTGIGQATANTNDATNMVKTAEGALNEVQNLLMSMRQLAVHASNLGVNSAADTAADQTQFASALSSIDRIATTTQFSNKKLLDGSASSATTTTSGSAAVTGAGANIALVASGSWGTANNYTFGSNSLTAASAATDTFAVSNAATVNLSNTAGASQTMFSGKMVINGATYTLSSPTTATNAPNQSLAQLNSAIQASGYQASLSATGGLTFTNQTAGPAGATPSFDLSGLSVGQAGSLAATSGTSTGANAAVVTSTLASGSTLLASQTTASTNVLLTGKVTITNATATGGTSTTAATVFDFGNGTTMAAANNILKGTAADASGATHNVQMKATTDGSNNLVFTTLQTDATGATTAAADVIVAGDASHTGHDFQAYNGNAVAVSGTFADGANAQMILSDGTAAHNQTSSSTQMVGSTSYYTFANGAVLSTTAAATTTGTTALSGTLTPTVGSSSKGQDLQFQIGANGGQTVTQSISSVHTDQLGKSASSYTDASGATQTVLTDSLKDINLSTFKGAQDALAVIDKAISDTSTLRANLGAFQSNVLQSNANSLGIANQNLQSSVSSIVDTDLSSEIVNYTKNQILVQAATSALGQANQAPQGIMKLLQ